MTIESATYIGSLNSSYPEATSAVSEGDDHIRLIKSTIKASFPSVTGAVTATHTELNILDGVTASTAELNILDGITASTTELNYVDGVTSAIQTQLNNKQPYPGTFSVKDDDFNAATLNHYILRTNSSKTATLPASPAAGDTIWFTNTSGGNWTLDRNTKNIMGAGANLTMATAKHYEVVYYDATTGWVLTRDA